MQHISGKLHLNVGKNLIRPMKEFIFKTFARLFAVLGCSTLVTACYGVPYDDFDAKVIGRVTDSQTGQPVKGVMVKMTAGSRSQMGDNAVQSLSPLSSTIVTYTDADGRFDEDLDVYGIPDGVLVECFDVDGEVNGSYLPAAKVYPIEEEGRINVDIEVDAD